MKSNVMEEVLADFPSEETLLETIPNAYATEDFTIDLHCSSEDGLAFFTVTALDPKDGTVIYSLQSAKAFEEGGTS